MSERPVSRGSLADPLPVEPLAAPPDATVRLPGSKSLTNRALLAAALADGRSSLRGVLLADDTLAMIECLRSLGVAIECSGDESQVVAVVDGVAGRWPVDTAELDARQSGTTARFLLAALSLGPGPYVLDGDPQLRARPMGDLVDALRRVGLTIVERGEDGALPVSVQGGLGSSHHSSVSIAGDVSSQFLSGLLLAAPCTPKGLSITIEGEVVSEPYVAMTISVMEAFGASVKRQGAQVDVAPTGYRSARYDIEPDASAASYFFAAAAICGGRVRVEGLASSSLQGDVAFVDILEQMGAAVTRSPDALEVRGTGTLRGISANLAHFSDTAPTLGVVAAFADSPTEVTGIGFIRRKESDRIRAVVSELRRCGVGAEELPDGFRVIPAPIKPAVIQTYDDHRMAMSFAVMGLRAPGIEIADPGCVAKTFPSFYEVLGSLRR
jgi:3-phosphoshikimate 1-carboxyvinyltransferase